LHARGRFVRVAARDFDEIGLYWECAKMLSFENVRKSV